MLMQQKWMIAYAPKQRKEYGIRYTNCDSGLSVIMFT